MKQLLLLLKKIEIKLIIGKDSGYLRFCIPYETIKGIINKIDIKSWLFTDVEPNSPEKIEKIDARYNVYVQASDNIIYKYCNLESIDIHLYSYIKQKDVIGKAIYHNNRYEFALQIIKDNKYLSYYENSED